MSDAVILAIITLCSGIVTAATTVITTIIRGRASTRHSAKQSILQMIMEDHDEDREGRIPTNYQNILKEYDLYHKNGGNSYITEKVEEYKSWFAKVQSKHIDDKA